MAELAFRVLLAAHVADSPAEATIVLAAAAAFAGLNVDGTPMRGGGAPTTLRELAGELGLHVGAVRRGVQALVAAEIVRVDRAGVHVDAGKLQERWEARSCVVRLSADLRTLGLRCEPLLVAGVVAGELDEHGRVAAWLSQWSERTGLHRRAVMRAMATAEAAGAIHRWQMPPARADRAGMLCCAPGTRRETVPEKRRVPAPKKPSPTRRPNEPSRNGTGDGTGERREMAPRPSRNGHGEARREMAPPPSRNGPGTPGPRRRDGEIPDARARARGGRDPAAEPETRDPWHGLRRMLLSTRVREGLKDPLERWQFCDGLAQALHRQGQSETECSQLWSIAERHTDRGDPTGLFVELLAGPWLRTIEEHRSCRRCSTARDRGAAAAPEPSRRAREPQPIGDLGEFLAEALRRVRHG